MYKGMFGGNKSGGIKGQLGVGGGGGCMGLGERGDSRRSIVCYELKSLKGNLRVKQAQGFVKCRIE